MCLRWRLHGGSNSGAAKVHFNISFVPKQVNDFLNFITGLKTFSWSCGRSESWRKRRHGDQLGRYERHDVIFIFFLPILTQDSLEERPSESQEILRRNWFYKGLGKKCDSFLFTSAVWILDCHLYWIKHFRKNMIWALIVLVKSRYSSAKERLTELFAFCLQDAILLRYP